MPNSKGIFVYSANPNAAGTPESGTGTIMCVSFGIGFSIANSLPMFLRISYIDLLSIILSGRAKYTYSKIQKLDFCFLNGKELVKVLPWSIVMNSPGNTSLINWAPTISRAQVSEATIYELSNIPNTSGLIPAGSRQHIIVPFINITKEYAPLMVFNALITLSKRVFSVLIAIR
ncbi:hypothetical protein ECHLIB_0954 [Ehrlichia chaffeensis str. Liberty]|nr:hypothetical protein ECHLIB_0954 [Ehrlichia chaffeensis str. Liberty]AHX07640.1 hypothetical protein ECHOSC_0949 [Ehrlichia chaffeensis str. Osceola]AHX08312.1 hypothetical protein ECHSTV_0940 [Ehrlichia chaffeensis str. Saint Vincent]AHX09645.1 hypothetical protein ECHWAK_0951 [Ehrlichia chaffeensis str. Wakulla]